MLLRAAYRQGIGAVSSLKFTSLKWTKVHLASLGSTPVYTPFWGPYLVLAAVMADNTCCGLGASRVERTTLYFLCGVELCWEEKRYDLALFYKIQNNLINIKFPAIVQPSQRHGHRFIHIQSLHAEPFKYHFFVRTIRIWNLLPVEIATASTIDSFKQQSTSWIQPMQWTRINNTWTLTI